MINQLAGSVGAVPAGLLMMYQQVRAGTGPSAKSASIGMQRADGAAVCDCSHRWFPALYRLAGCQAGRPGLPETQTTWTYVLCALALAITL